MFVAASRDVLAQEHQLQHRGEPRARAADLRGGGGARHPRARLHFVRARLSVRRRRRSAQGRGDRRSAVRAWAPTRSRSRDTIGVGTAGKTAALFARVAERVPVHCARRPFPRHLRPGADECLRGDGNGRGDVRLLGRGTRRLPVRQRRDRQCRERGRRVPDERTRHRNRRRSRRKLRAAGQAISDVLGRPPVSRVARALAAKSPVPGTMSASERSEREARGSRARRLASACA